MKKVNINEVMEALEDADDETDVYYVPAKNTFIYISEYMDDETDIDEEEETVALPSKRDLNEYGMMQRFIDRLENEETQKWLRNAITGKGAFHRFRVTCERFGLLNDWYAYRERQIQRIAIAWCNDNAIEYETVPLYDADEEEDYEDDADFYEEEEEVPEEKPVLHIVEINEKNAFALTYMIAEFRVALSKLSGYKTEEDLDSAREEAQYYLGKHYPVFAASLNGKYVGYAVCKVEDSVVWLESLYVREDYRRQGIATKLLERCEKVAEEYKNDTLYINIHPNNERMIAFLNSCNYNVLNLIELRKAAPQERKKKDIQVGEHTYKY